MHAKYQSVPKIRENKNEPQRHDKTTIKSISVLEDQLSSIMPKDFSLPSLGKFFLQAPFPLGWHSLILLFFEMRELLGFVTALV